MQSLQKAFAEAQATVQFRHANSQNSRLKKGEVHWILMVNTYHHLNQPVSYLRHLRDKATQGILIIDFTHDPERPIGPGLGHGLVSKTELLHQLKQANYRIEDLSHLLPHQNMILARPAKK